MPLCKLLVYPRLNIFQLRDQAIVELVEQLFIRRRFLINCKYRRVEFRRALASHEPRHLITGIQALGLLLRCHVLAIHFLLNWHGRRLVFRCL